MLMGGMRAGPMAILVIYIVVLMGAAMGASAGFDAENVSQTEMYLENETLVVGNNETDVSFDAENASRSDPYEQAESTSPTLWLADRYGDQFPQIVPDRVNNAAQNASMTLAKRMYWGALSIAVGTADATATWTYHNRWWLPQWLVKGVLQLGMVIPIGGMLYVSFKRLQELRKQ